MTYKEYDKFLYARSLFDIREFDRASYILNSLTHPKCVFLKLYSKFMVNIIFILFIIVTLFLFDINTIINIYNILLIITYFYFILYLCIYYNY